jgi:hypothetical protein
VPPGIEAFRTSGAAAAVDTSVVIKRRKRRLRRRRRGAASTWRRCAKTPRGRFCSGMPAGHRRRRDSWTRSTTAVLAGRDVLCPEGERLQGLGKANRRLIVFLQERRPQAVAALDVDATILESQKRSALPTYDGRTGCQPVAALWAEQA